MYFFASLTFLVVGLSLSMFTQTMPVSGYSFGPAPSWHQTQAGHQIQAGTPYMWNPHPYRDLGLSLFGFGIFLVGATFYQSLVGEKKREPLSAKG